MNLFVFKENCGLDFIVVGCLCIDLNVNEIQCLMEEIKIFIKYVGGFLVNIVIGVVRLGLKIGFIGKVLDD